MSPSLRALGLLALLTLGACGGAGTPTPPTPSPAPTGATSTPSPASTPSPTGAPTSTPTPTGDPTSTPTPTGAPTSTPTPTGDPTSTPTPTGVPTPTALPASRVVLNEVSCAEDWIELVSPDARGVDLAGWRLTDDPTNPGDIYTFPTGARLEPGQFLVIVEEDGGDPGFPFGIKCASDTLWLLDPAGEAQDTFSPGELADRLSWGRLPDGTGDWVENAPSPGAANTPASAEDPAAFLFDPLAVTEIDLTLGEAEMAQLDADPYSYVAGTLRLTRDGQAEEQLAVGVRLKGRYGSFRTLAEKAGFKVKIDYTDNDQRLYGLKKLTLNNMVQDPSMIHEAAAYHLFNTAGVPAPRLGYTWVRVNGEPYGLYANVETLDDVSLDLRFSDTHHLYEGAYGSDVFVGGEYSFEVDEGDEEDRADLTAVIDAANAPLDGAWVGGMEAQVDLEEMLTMWATELYIGHWDGYVTRNNYYLHSSDDGPATMMPWGTDQTFDLHLSFSGSTGVMFLQCMAQPDCLARYFEAVEGLFLAVDAADLPTFITDVREGIAPWVAQDPRRPYTAEDVAYFQDAALWFLDARPAEAETWLRCVRDKSCPPCDEVYRGDHPYRICTYDLPWSDARGVCQDQGLDLVILNSPAEESWLINTAGGVYGLSNVWLGLDDRAEEGTFRWVDGSTPTYTSWALGEPNNSGEEDCGELTTWGGWNDLPCGTTRAFVCEAACAPGTDADLDGFDACTSDCDDTDPDSHPGATDTCGDGLDQDCSGEADDGPGCTECVTVLDGEERYLFCSKGRTFDEARAHCQLQGADLAVFQDEIEWGWALEQAHTQLGWVDLWFGLSDVAEEGVWTWVDGSPLTYAPWAGGEPNNAGEEDCAGAFPDGPWNDYPCSFALASVCEDPCEGDLDEDGDGFKACAGDCDDTNAAIHPGADEACGGAVDANCDGVVGGECPSGCRPLASASFTGTYCAEARAWLEAADICRSAGGALATFDDASQQGEVVATLLADFPEATEVWFGLNDRRREGTYVWPDGESPDWETWAAGQPNNGGLGGEQDCVRLLGDATWNDTACDALYPVLCEATTP